MLARIRRRLLYSRTFRGLVRFGRRFVLPGFEGFSLYEISRLFIRALQDGNLVTRASAITFKLFVAFFPAAIVVLTLIPLIPGVELKGQVLQDFGEMLPRDVYRFLETTFQDLRSRPQGTLLSFSFVGAVYLASNSIDAILRGFSGSSNLISWHRPWKQRLLSIGLLLVLSALLAIAVLLLTASGGLIRLLEREHVLTSGLQVVALHAVRWSVAIALTLLSIALLYHAGEPGRRRFRLFSPGTIVAVAMIGALSQLLAYVFGHVTDYNVLYGSIGAILAVQLWLYMNMIVVLVGWELNLSIRRAQREHRPRLRLERANARDS